MQTMMNNAAPVIPAATQDALDLLLKDRMNLATCVSGSALYGTATAKSDDDFRCVFLPTKTEILTGHVFFGDDNNKANKRLGQGDIDIAGVSLMRYLSLLGRMDMITTELLFAAQDDALRVGPKHPVFDKVFAQREMLLAGNSNSAIGHARQRIGGLFPSNDASLAPVRAAHEVLTRVAEGNRLLDEPEKIAELAAIDGVEVITQQNDRFVKSRDWAEMTDDERATGLADGQPVFIKVAGKKISVSNPLREAIRVVERPLNRDAEQKRVVSRGDAVIWKDAYQGVRMIYQAIELHETRALVFPRPEAPLLRRIRGAEMEVEELQEVISEAMERLREVEAAYPFPEVPCKDTTESLVCEAHEMVVRS